jgi:hypothetical protein
VNFWSGDVGDLLARSADSPPKIIGRLTGSPTENGVLVSCYDGRLILQTFSSHDYPAEAITALWQNYAEYGVSTSLDQLTKDETALSERLAFEARRADTKILPPVESVELFKQDAKILLTGRATPVLKTSPSRGRRLAKPKPLSPRSRRT